MALADLLVPTDRQRLGTSAGLLDRALEQRPGAAKEPVAARRRLFPAPDLLPLASQIRVAASQTQEAVCLLGGQALPGRLVRGVPESWDVRDRPGTVAAATARLAQALAALDRPDGLAFDPAGASDRRDWARPRFHVDPVSASDPAEPEYRHRHRHGR